MADFTFSLVRCGLSCPVRLPLVSPVVVAGQLSKCNDQLTQSMQMLSCPATHLLVLIIAAVCHLQQCELMCELADNYQNAMIKLTQSMQLAQQVGATLVNCPTR